VNRKEIVYQVGMAIALLLMFLWIYRLISWRWR